jgi:3-dehydroquinate synthetase
LRYFEALNLPTRPGGANWGLTQDLMFSAMQKDKKNHNGKLYLILSHGIGKAFLTPDVDTDQLQNCLTAFLT